MLLALEQLPGREMETTLLTFACSLKPACAAWFAPLKQDAARPTILHSSSTPRGPGRGGRRGCNTRSSRSTMTLYSHSFIRPVPRLDERLPSSVEQLCLYDHTWRRRSMACMVPPYIYNSRIEQSPPGVLASSVINPDTNPARPLGFRRRAPLKKPFAVGRLPD
jgi:hypothetical protein